MSKFLYKLRKTYGILQKRFDSLTKNKQKSPDWLDAKQQTLCDSAQLIYFFGPNFTDNVGCTVSGCDCLFTNRNFSENRKTVLYIHDYLESPRSESVYVLVNAYAKLMDVNFVLLNWSSLATGSYLFNAIPNTRRFGPYMADHLIRLFNCTLDINRLHIVGYSLGAQLAGLIGHHVQKKTNGEKKIPRISGLDPAFPIFLFGGLAHRLNKYDACYVDVIHTDAWGYGYPWSMGHADFWPNGGTVAQPGVPKRSRWNHQTDDDVASHQRSWSYWAESVSYKNPTKFEAVRADSWNDFKDHKLSQCQPREKVLMGAHCPMGAKGDFFLQTNGKPPYARGKAGTVYIRPAELPGNECDANKIT